ncbi:MAG: phosphate/phosphite/phosphonate ABC transporter substrate-binding protein [Burkholderiales bacterium]|nr:phosphate/phosphite/phosphonate ABC transporter substrate-binding protein [Burkholderiales bacterium]
MKPTLLHRLVALGAGLLILAGTAAAAPTATYTISVVPQFTAVEIDHDWTPVLARLAQETGYHFKLEVSASIPKFETSVLAGGPDFAYLNPYHEVMARRAQGYIPLVRGSKPLQGILVVRKDAAIHSVADLEGQSIAFPAPNAFGASLWMRALLSGRYKLHFTPTYVRTHSNCYLHVATGRTAACGAIARTLAEQPPEVQSALRVLFQTPGVPPHPLAAHPRVPPAVRERVAQALLGMARDAPGQALLKDIEMNQPVRADYARDYAPLERFGLEKYVVRPPAP